MEINTLQDKKKKTLTISYIRNQRNNSGKDTRNNLSMRKNSIFKADNSIQ